VVVLEISAKVKDIITKGYLNEASDIHFHPEKSVYRLKYRIDGLLQNVESISREEGLLIISSIKVLGKLDISQRRLPQDGSFKYKVGNDEIDIRISTVNTIKGEKMVLRLFKENPTIKNFKDLGMNKKQQKTFEKMLNIKSGMILVVGPTGSGKTTTLYTALNYLKDSTKNFVTIEDPVEYQLEDVTQINIEPRIGLTFPNALKAVLRQDPDGILIGEIRDKETAEIAVRASLTGHILLSTLHTENCQSAILRLVDMGIERYLLAEGLKGIVAQRLFRLKCHCQGDCFCNNTGYYKRSGIFEILPITESVKLQIIQGKRQFNWGNYDTLKELAEEKVKEGLTDIKEIYRILD
jgi:type II secretory ATPase GspE/PulE/Tfp pilus assembly ATPase PilB-like protein